MTDKNGAALEEGAAQFHFMQFAFALQHVNRPTRLSQRPGFQLLLLRVSSHPGYLHIFPVIFTWIASTAPSLFNSVQTLHFRPLRHAKQRLCKHLFHIDAQEFEGYPPTGGM
jgi:hypothetical protein